MSNHFYDKQGNPHHFVERKDGNGNRKATLADCKKNGWLPGVTTVLDVLAKPALTKWMINQAVDAVLTAPRLQGEALDAFKARVLDVESQQDEEAQKARDFGSKLHDAMERLLSGKSVDSGLMPWIEPASKHLLSFSTVIVTEKILVGDGYAGKCDVILRTAEGMEICDFKFTKTLPTKAAWPEHRLQCAAYAAASQMDVVRTSNLYISTIDQGKFVYFPHAEPWRETFQDGFLPLLHVWRWMNNFYPNLFE